MSDLLPTLIAAVRTRHGHERWDVVDTRAAVAANDPDVINWALCVGIKNIDARLRELAALLLCLTDRALEELVPLMAQIVETDANIRVRGYLALALWMRMDLAGQTEHLRQIVDVALADPEISSPVKQHFLRCRRETRPEEVFA